MNICIKTRRVSLAIAKVLPMPTQTLIKRKPKVWTKSGLAQLGLLIRAARTDKGMSLDDVVQLILDETFIKISKKTIGNVENNVGMPQYNTLAAIAAAGFVLDQTGNPLSVENFMDIACESELSQPFNSYGVSAMSIVDLIQSAMRINGLSQEEVEAELKRMQQTGTGKMSLARLWEIQQGSGNPILDDELRIIRVLVDRSETAYPETTWLLAAQKSLADQPRGQENGLTNGRC